MKKLMICLLVLVLTLSLTALAAAENVYVTICDGDGNIVMANEAVDVTDADGDGAITVYDALYAAHEQGYEGGAAAGFAAETSDYGLSLTKLWGVENGGAFGYYVNDVSAMSLFDAVADSDRVKAFVYTDLTNFSDSYALFDSESADLKLGETLTLTLNVQSYDADWNVVTAPLANAIITIDGEDSAFTTDVEGKVEITPETAGEHLISARSDELVLVPPLCIAVVSEN